MNLLEVFETDIPAYFIALKCRRAPHTHTHVFTFHTQFYF